MLALSEDGGTPAAVAALLTGLGWGPSRLTVFSDLGGPREAVVESEARRWGGRRVADLNTIALECRAGPGARALSRLAGLPDDAFEHDGQLTKREVRAATMAALAPLAGETLWDVGAGCGSIAIEWLRAGEQRRRGRSRARPGAGREDCAQRRGARRAGPARRSRLSTRGAGGPAAARRGLCRRRDRRAGPVAGAVEGVAAGRPARRQCRDRRGRVAAAGLAGPPRRRADADRGQPRRARRHASSVAILGERHPACRRQAGMR